MSRVYCRLGVVLSLWAVAMGASAQGSIPLGLPESERQDGWKAAELVGLGQKLFFEKRLSVDGSISCASCHLPERRFTDGRPRANGLHGARLTRHTPSLLNVGYAGALFWDGRVTGLENQVRSPLLAPAEHALLEESAVARIIRSTPEYVSAFSSLLGVSREGISIREVGLAIAAYERTLTAGNSPFDRYQYGGDPQAMTAAAVRGLNLFRGRAQCANCHTMGEKSALFTDGTFHTSPLPLGAGVVARLGNLAKRVTALRERGEFDALNSLIESDPNVAALGRFNATLDPKDIGSFKTPSLRNVTDTGPYMHDGSVETLGKAVDLELYSRASQRYPLVITEDERSDLLQFLAALSSPN
ncbi:MAG TPA: cytochrome c peroxidase [Steroidobacteraceae bacterium]|jgi:cytochrome c peroxidase|nr:cytochrome c peroxidase [Steroidobacteraceae bacterium]